MRHLKAGKKLGRNASHRRALYRNMAMALIRHERIITTLPKAKAVKPFIEKLITLAKKAVDAEPGRALHLRRLAISRLGTTANAELKPGDEADSDDTKIVEKLFAELGPRFKERPGGYTRIIKRHERRLGDAGFTAFLELLKEGEEKVRAHAPSAPAPDVEDEEDEDEDVEDEEDQEDKEQEDEDEEKSESSASDEEDEEDEDEDEEDEDEEKKS